MNLSKQDSNFLKGIALILLLIHHLFYIQNGLFEDIYLFHRPIVHYLGLACKVCVAIFVFLSGYACSLTVKINQKSDIFRFYLIRLKKLLLNYWLIWILFVPVGIFIFNRTFQDVYHDNLFLNFILDFFGLINITGRYGYNPTWWFYSCILLLYLIFPIIHCTSNKYPNSIWLFLCLGIIIIKIPFIFLNPIKPYLLPFTLGIFMNSRIYNSSIKKFLVGSNFIKNIIATGKSAYIPFVLIMLLITCAVIRLRSWEWVFIWDTLITILLVLLYKVSTPSQRLKKSMEYLGRHSFNIFLFHTFIYYMFFPTLIYWSKNPVIIFFSLLISCIVISIGIEKLKSFIHLK